MSKKACVEKDVQTKITDAIAEAFAQMVQRDEDGNLLDPWLNNQEALLFERLQKEGCDCATREAEMSAYKTKLPGELIKVITAAVQEFDFEKKE